MSFKIVMTDTDCIKLLSTLFQRVIPNANRAVGGAARDNKFNILYIRDLLKDYDGEIFRLALLSGNYRQPLNFTKDTLYQSKSNLNRFFCFRAIKSINNNMFKKTVF